ncbi:MAG TPA: hypothetical protein VFT90_15045 [Chryseosolibacter sp.]|nr:hypothetical protein [Chryseosolibacter sp.]
MKAKGFLIAALLTSSQLFAQNDSTVYRFGLPVSEDDTAGQFLQTDRIPENDWKAVPLKDLPKGVLEAIKEQKQYKGWRDSTVYFEKNTGLYLVPVEREDGIRIYGLNENGNPVTFDMIRKP